MKRLIVLLTLSLLATSSMAQTPLPPPVIAPFGPFEFGMSTEQARAAAGAAGWDEIADPDLQRGTMRSRAPVAEIAGISFDARLAYIGNAIAFINLSTTQPLSPSVCESRHRALVESQVRLRGPFMRREPWTSFREQPDALAGRVSVDLFLSAQRTETSFQSGRNTGVILTYAAPQHGQAFYIAAGGAVLITAHSIAHGVEAVCRIAILPTYPRDISGLRPSDGPGGAERLAARLAEAEQVRPTPYLVAPDLQLVQQRHYPRRALDENVAGDVTLNCLVLADGLLDCMVTETPLEYGFGEAAQRIASAYRVDVFAADPGKRTSMTLHFRSD